MKVTVENDKGERKEFECDGLAIVAQSGKETKTIIDGACDFAQWACARNGPGRNHSEGEKR